MATLKQAERARREHADELAAAGVHAVGVEPGGEFRQPGYVVVAFVEPRKRVKLPDTLPASATQTRVPLVVRRSEAFEAEAEGL